MARQSETRLTKRRMLERKRNYIFDSFYGHGQGVTGKSFTDNNLDSTEVVGWTPIILLKKLLAEGWEFQRLEFTIFGEF